MTWPKNAKLGGSGSGSIINRVGGIPTPLKNMSSSVGMIIPYMKWKNKKCLKPPTRLIELKRVETMC